MLHPASSSEISEISCTRRDTIGDFRHDKATAHAYTCKMLLRRKLSQTIGTSLENYQNKDDLSKCSFLIKTWAEKTGNLKIT